MDIGKRVRTLRKAVGLTQEDVARRAGVTLTVVNRLERGVSTDPHYSTLQGLAAALNMTVEQLVKEEEAPPVLAGKAAAPLGEAGLPVLQPRAHGPEASEAGRVIRVVATDSAGATDAVSVIVTVDTLAAMMSAIEAGELSAVEAMEHLVPA